MGKAEHEGRTEQATPRQVERYRKEGQVVVSREIISVSVLAASMAALYFSIGPSGQRLLQASRQLLGNLDVAALGQGDWVSPILFSAILLVLPIGAAGLVAALASGLGQTKGLFVGKPLVPDIKKLNPLPKLKNLFFSKQAAVTLLQSVGKVGVVVALTFDLFVGEVRTLLSVNQLSVIGVLEHLVGAIGELVWRATLIFIVFAVIDYIVQHRRMQEQMKMSKQDVKDDMRNQEGDPLIKRRQRMRAREILKSRMISEVPKADVVLVNPTHYAVAIRYEPAIMAAPQVTAKGADNLAARIRDLARQHGVPVLHNPPLARSVYAQVDLGREITPELYAAVAEVLAMVYRLKGRAQ